MSFMQVPINTGATFATLLSPPLSPSSLIKLNNEKSHEKSHGEQQKKIITQILSNNESKPKNKYRMRLCDAPPELLEMIRRSEIKNEKSLPEKSSSIINASNVVKNASSSSSSSSSSTSSSSTSSSASSSFSTTSSDRIPNFHKIISTDEKRHRFRKNPYPKKAPSKSSPGITLQVDVYTTLKEDPRALLRRNDQSINSSTTSINSSIFTDSSSGTESSSPPSSPILQQRSTKKQITRTKTRTKRTTKPIISERKRKGNSLARVMADRGLLESTLTPIIVAGEIKPIRIPPPPPMQFDELMKNIEQLNLDLTVLQRINPKINWKGQPLSISHLPHHNSLHPKEAHVASTLRLTPVQYLTAKHTLISSARRYAQKSLPFRKSDAQKLLRIDVNKASKLWEFFMQVEWI